MSKVALFALIAIVFVSIGGALFLDNHPRELGCKWLQKGVWAPNGARCITEICYETGTCGLRSFPAAYCSDVSIGDSISQVVLRLGEPMSSQDNRLQWHWDKVTHGVGVEAYFKQGQLISLECTAFPVSN